MDNTNAERQQRWRERRQQQLTEARERIAELEAALRKGGRPAETQKDPLQKKLDAALAEIERLKRRQPAATPGAENETLRREVAGLQLQVIALKAMDAAALRDRVFRLESDNAILQAMAGDHPVDYTAISRKIMSLLHPDKVQDAAFKKYLHDAFADWNSFADRLWGPKVRAAQQKAREDKERRAAARKAKKEG